MMWVPKQSRSSFGKLIRSLAVCVIITGSFAGLTGCIQVPPQTWIPTQQYSGYQEFPNFFVCKDFVDKNESGKLEHDEVKNLMLPRGVFRVSFSQKIKNPSNILSTHF